MSTDATNPGPIARHSRYLAGVAFLPSFAGLRISTSPAIEQSGCFAKATCTTSSDSREPSHTLVPYVDMARESRGSSGGADDPMFGVISIAYSGDPSGNRPFLTWDATPRLSVVIGVRTAGAEDGDGTAGPSGSEDDEVEGSEDGDAQADTVNTARRGGGRRKLTERTPHSLIDPGDFDPMEEEFTYDALRQDLQEHIAVARRIGEKVDDNGDGTEERDNDAGETVTDEMVAAAISDPLAFSGDVAVTVDSMMLLCAFNVYYYNGTVRGEVKPEGSSIDAEDELLARWREGKVGRSKAGTRVHPKGELVDRVNYGRSALGNMPPEFKEDASERVVQLLQLLDGLKDEWGESGTAATELADALIAFDDDSFDINYWAVHQVRPRICSNFACRGCMCTRNTV